MSAERIGSEALLKVYISEAVVEIVRISTILGEKAAFASENFKNVINAIVPIAIFVSGDKRDKKRAWTIRVSERIIRQRKSHKKFRPRFALFEIHYPDNRCAASFSTECESKALMLQRFAFRWRISDINSIECAPIRSWQRLWFSQAALPFLRKPACEHALLTKRHIRRLFQRKGKNRIDAGSNGFTNIFINGVLSVRWRSSDSGAKAKYDKRQTYGSSHYLPSNYFLWSTSIAQKPANAKMLRRLEVVC
ncbi:MAG: hypothetical protein AAF936_14505 [Pseudomonadota bacterium]